MEEEKYELKNGEGYITLNKNGHNYEVDCWDKHGNNRWGKLYREEVKARQEFERWRK